MCKSKAPAPQPMLPPASPAPPPPPPAPSTTQPNAAPVMINSDDGIDEEIKRRQRLRKLFRSQRDMKINLPESSLALNGGGGSSGLGIPTQNA